MGTALLGSPTNSNRFDRAPRTAGREGRTTRYEVDEPLPFYLRLVWLDDTAPLTDEWYAAIERKEPRELKPGEQYRVQVQFLSRPTVGTSGPIYPESDLKLALAYLVEGSSRGNSLTITPNQPLDVPLGETREYCGDFRLTVAPDCCLEEGTLLLSCLNWLEGKFLDPCQLPVKIRLMGSLRNEVAQRVKLALDEPIVPGQIFIHAVEAKNDRLSVIGFHGYDRRYPLEEREPIERPDKALSKLMEVWKDNKKMLNKVEFERLTRTIENEVQTFSRKHAGNLLDWLIELIVKDRNASVVIADHTRFEIPWELIELVPGKPLGAEVRVSRWTTVSEYVLTTEEFRKGDLTRLHRGSKGYFRLLRIKPDRRVGSAVTYLDSALPDLGHPPLDRPLAERCTDMQKLLNRLNQDVAGVCLVYLYCHGEFDEVESRRTSVGSLWAINFAEVLPKDEDRPLFFVNACHSGRLTGSSEGAEGLPEELLARVACGYIGTLGPVEERLATEVATTLLNQAIEGPEPMYPAEALRKLRKDAFEARNKSPDDKGGMARFLNAFMYVYYGNPLASFQLRPPPNPGGGP
jgi:hypothetical protein